MFMVKSDDQRQKALKRIEGLKAQIQNLRQQRVAEQAALFARTIRQHIADLEGQILTYDTLRKQGIGPLKPQHLSEVGPYLIKARIAAGLAQTELAKKLGVSQPMVHKYENSEYQGANLELLSNVAQILGVSLHLETFRQPGSRGYDPKRQEEAMLFFAQEISNIYLGKTKLMKLLYYADYEWIQKKGVSITGDTYVAMPYGPVPKHAQDALRRLEKAGALRIEKVTLGTYDQDRCTGLREPDLALFTSQELAHLHSIARRFEFWTAKQMSDLTHEDWPWQSTHLGGDIVFYRIREG